MTVVIVKNLYFYPNVNLKPAKHYKRGQFVFPVGSSLLFNITNHVVAMPTVYCFKNHAPKHVIPEDHLSQRDVFVTCIIHYTRYYLLPRND